MPESPSPSIPKKAAASRSTTKKSESPASVSSPPVPPKKATAVHKTAQKSESPIPVPVTLQERHAMICNAAYYLAEGRGFIGGDPFRDWVEAEKQVDRLLGAS